MAKSKFLNYALPPTWKFCSVSTIPRRSQGIMGQGCHHFVHQTSISCLWKLQGALLRRIQAANGQISLIALASSNQIFSFHGPMSLRHWNSRKPTRPCLCPPRYTIPPPWVTSHPRPQILPLFATPSMPRILSPPVTLSLSVTLPWTPYLQFVSAACNTL